MYHNIVKEVKSEKGSLKIYLDNCPEDPRNWDNMSKMVCFHRKYNLGDDHNYKVGDYSGWHELAEAIEKDYDIAAMVPLYMYDHSGITISTTPFSCPWDSGQIGWAFITKDVIRKEFGMKRVSAKAKERALEVLLAEIQVYDEYLRGDVYGYTLEDENGDLVDSCWGFYGDTGLKEIIENIPKEYSDLLVEATA